LAPALPAISSGGVTTVCLKRNQQTIYAPSMR
jgi:hypothetical protein